MKFSVFSDLEWTYPDTALTDRRSVELSCAKNGHTGFQLLGEALPEKSALQISMEWENEGDHPAVESFELIDIGVEENTGAKLYTTTDYESCKAFVTRKAPFRVYDCLRPPEGVLQGTRLALYFRFTAPPELSAGEHRGTLTVFAGEEKLSLPVRLQVYSAVIPKLPEAKLSFIHFFSYQNLALQEKAQPDTEEYWEAFRRYVRAQQELRCSAIMLPPGEAVFSPEGKISFDFSRAVRAAEIAFEEGIRKVCGCQIAKRRDAPPYGYTLNWETPGRKAETASIERYFSTWRQIVAEKGWEGRVMQSLADEPQPYSAAAYRELATCAREYLPGVPFLEAVETPNLGDALDIWIPKQVHYEEKREDYERLRAEGKTLWFYTCAFPAGPTMNRSMDLPLVQCREVFWMGFFYDFTGFLHWGFNYHEGKDLWNFACCEDPQSGKKFPAGDSNIVYPGKNGPWRSMRYEAQRGGVEDFELLRQLERKSPKEARDLVRRICTSFRAYNTSASAFESNRRLLLEACEKLER